jgi:glycogen synthase
MNTLEQSTVHDGREKEYVRRPRIFAALGPGDIVRARKTQLAGGSINETSIAFSEQFIWYCKKRGYETLGISSNSRTEQYIDEFIRLENRPKPLQGTGFRFHLSQILYAIYLVWRARRFGASIAFIDSGTTHYFALALFPLLGIPVVVNLHNVLWPRGFPPKGRLSRTIRALNAAFFRYAASGAIGVSPECERQVLSEAEYQIPFRQYRCQFRLAGFKFSEPYSRGPFRIAFVGRAEKSKGLLDLVEIADHLRTKSALEVVFEVCGDGRALSELRELVAQNGLSSSICVHGRLERDQLMAVYGRCHAVIVPTRSDFPEGMPQVCAEAVLSGLPVVTSTVANAFDVIGPATIEAETDNTESYVAAILLLIESSTHGRLTAEEYSSLALQFTDRGQSYPAAVDKITYDVLGFAPLDNYEVLFQE